MTINVLPEPRTSASASAFARMLPGLALSGALAATGIALGRIAWRSPQAAVWLEALEDSSGAGQLPAAIKAALEVDSTQVVHTRTTPALSVRNMGIATLGETMLLLELQSEDSVASSRLSHAALTPRETEVLSWLAKGKTNRDIADILGMSPRTVNKHLEHIFEKLGVETRAAAAALASGHLA